jgi:hypothetical protein
MKSGNCVKKQSASLEGAVTEWKVIKRQKKEEIMKKEQLTNDKKMKGVVILSCLVEFELGLAWIDFVWSNSFK